MASRPDDAEATDRRLVEPEEANGRTGPKPMLDDEYLKKAVISLLTKGVSQRAIERLGICSADTIQRHEKRDPDFAAATKNARANAVRNAVVQLVNFWVDESMPPQTRLTALIAHMKMNLGISDRPDRDNELNPSGGNGTGRSFVDLMKQGGMVDNRQALDSPTADTDQGKSEAASSGTERPEVAQDGV